MAVGVGGQNGSLVLSHVGQGPKRELAHVPTHRLKTEVPFVEVYHKKNRCVAFHVKVSV